MKKRLVAACIWTCVLMAAMVSSCSDDDTIEYNKTYVKYKLTLGPHFQMFYGIEVVYCDMEGKVFNETVPSLELDSRTLRSTWSYKDEKDGDHDIKFGFKAIARCKPIPTSFDKTSNTTYDLSHSAAVSWYTKTTGAKVYAPTNKSIDSLKLDTAQLRSYLNTHQEIILMDYPTDVEQ